MSAVLAFIGTFLLSLFVALLAALQFADYFNATEEFIVVLLGLPVFVLFCMLVFIVAYLAARRARLLNWVAILLGLLAFAPLALPGLAEAIAGRSTNPFAIDIASIAIATEMIVPALLAVLVQWGLVRRRWLRANGEDDLSRWPWVVTIVAGLAILNPFALDVLGQAIAYRAGNMMRDFARNITLIAGGMVIAMALIEYYIRGRMRNRRMAQSPLAAGTAAPG